MHLCIHEDNCMPHPPPTTSTLILVVTKYTSCSSQRALGNSHKIGKCVASKQVVRAKEDEGFGPHQSPRFQFSRKSSGDENLRFVSLRHPHHDLTLPPPMTFSAAYTDFPHRGHFSDSPNFAENLEGLLVVAARAGFGDLVGA